jgi:carbonic anhydrase/acetyltransferase-like protein (isoleucine patch superfamily)
VIYFLEKQGRAMLTLQNQDGANPMDTFSYRRDEMRTAELFEPGHTAAWGFLSRFTWPWEALSGISDCILELGAALSGLEYGRPFEKVWIHNTASVAPTAHIGPGVIIGPGAEVRHGAFIRENALVGAGAVVGNSTELKNVILFDEVQTPHYNYVGDSILGYKSHMGAGSITSNVKSDHSPVFVRCGGGRIETGLKKFGAILGDGVEIGCNAVLNPGSVIGARATVYPLSFVRGFVPGGSIYKKQGEIAKKVDV